jgi:ribonuclease HI
MHQEILALETALARRDLAALPGGPGAVLHEEFLEVGASGRRWTRAETLAILADAAEIQVAIDEVAFLELASDVVLLTYRLHGPDGPGPATIRSSIWVRTGTRWQVRFHQGTRYAE